MRRESQVIRLTITSIFIALYFVLSQFATIKLGNLRISFAGIIIIYASLLFYVKDAVFIALSGEFLLQLLSEYGLTATTPLWIIPPVLRALIISLSVYFLRKKNFTLIGPKKINYLIYFLICIIANLVTTATNTAVIFLDAYIFDYPASYVQLETLYRFLISILNSTFCALVVIPLYLRTNKYVSSVYPKDIKNIDNNTNDEKQDINN